MIPRITHNPGHYEIQQRDEFGRWVSVVDERTGETYKFSSEEEARAMMAQWETELLAAPDGRFSSVEYQVAFFAHDVD